MIRDEYDLTVDEYEGLMGQGLLFKMFPDAPINVHLFKKKKSELQLHRDVFAFLLDFSETTGCDPEELWNLFEQYSGEIYRAMENTDNVDIESVLKQLEGDNDE